jgi:ribosomal protein S18 acetylase RimI-like enzyme
MPIRLSQYTRQTSSSGARHKNKHAYIHFSTVALPQLLCRSSAEKTVPAVEKLTTSGLPFCINILQPNAVKATAGILTDAYCSIHNFQVYRKWTYRNILSYLKKQLLQVPKSLILCAYVKSPSVHIENMQLEDAGNEDHCWSVAGVVEVQFSKSVRNEFPFLNAPDDCGFLCNMAVIMPLRRQGIATALLSAAEQATLSQGKPAIYMLVRYKDPSALAFYLKAGYTVADTHSPLVALLGIDRQLLLCKNL